jgi:hypothetical protein
MRRGWLEDLMKGTLQRSVSLSVAVCLLLLGGLIYVQTVPHSLHHNHHQAATHSTALCSWLCAAGQSIDGGPVVLQAGSTPLTFLPHPVADVPISIDRSLVLLRGPPLLFV